MGFIYKLVLPCICLLVCSFLLSGCAYRQGDAIKTIVALDEKYPSDDRFLAASALFKRTANSLSTNTVTAIIDCIKSGHLTDRQAIIGVYIMSFGLPTEAYCRVASPLLNNDISPSLIDKVLYPSYPFGSGYSICHNNPDYRYKISLLTNSVLAGRLYDNYNLDMLSLVKKIEREVVDLTSYMVLFYSMTFIQASAMMTTNTAEFLVAEILQGNLSSETQVYIAILLISYSLDEEYYWKVCLPLLSDSKQNSNLRYFILTPWLPFGPGYSNAYKSELYRDAIRNLDRSGYIMSGRAARDYRRFLNSPTRFNHAPWVGRYKK